MIRCVLCMVAGLAVALTSPVALGGQEIPAPSVRLPPVYLHLFMHNEEPLAGRPDWLADRAFYMQNRSLLKKLVEAIHSRGAAFNFQSDWNYLMAAALYEVPPVTDDTNGKNIVRWMAEDMGVEVDPHAHETQYNYADVAYLVEQLGVTPTKTVGGFLYDPPDNEQGWEQHEDGIYGWKYPSSFWRADVLWGAATKNHQGNDDHSSGIWRPKDRYHFTENDPGRRLIYVGSGCGGGVRGLLDRVGSGEAPSDGFYTATSSLIQDGLTEQVIAETAGFIDSLAPEAAGGQVVWATISRTVAAWKAEHGGESSRYACGSPSASYETETLETWVTGPGGAKLYTRIVQPKAALYPGQRFPALVTVPGGTGDGAPMADSPGAKGLAAEGWVYVAFNLLGRGKGLPGNQKSEGETNCNGFLDQDALKAVVEYAAGLANVDDTSVGLLTSSFGVAVGAGAVGRHPDLPVAYFVDVEGPHDSRVICFYDAGHEVAVCGHKSLATDASAENEAFWSEREAVRHIGSYRGRYLRIQAEVDHAQNPHYFRHAIEMVNAATHPDYGGNGDCLWTRMNGSDVGNPVNSTYFYSDPASYPAWLSGKVHQDHAGIEIQYAKELAALAADQAPSCSITSPAEGDTVACAVSIQVAAADDSGITKVECHANYQVIGERTAPPYTFDWDSREAANGTCPIYAVANDAAGQSARSETVLVSVSNPRITGYSYSVTNTGKILLLKGEKFESGCTAYVDGVAKATVFKDSGTVKVKNTKWKKGQTLRFKVENPGGCASYEVSFTRP